MSTFTRTAAPLARFQAELPQDRKPPKPRSSESTQGTECDWLQWYLDTNPQPLLTNDELRALALEKGHKLPPGTIDQHDAYIHAHDGKQFCRFVRQLRQKAIFGLWADGSKQGPALPDVRDVGIETMKWLLAQATPNKYLKWFRQNDPAGWAAFLAANPRYGSQVAPVTPKLADFTADETAA